MDGKWRKTDVRWWQYILWYFAFLSFSFVGLCIGLYLMGFCCWSFIVYSIFDKIFSNTCFVLSKFWWFNSHNLLHGWPPNCCCYISFLISFQCPLNCLRVAVPYCFRLFLQCLIFLHSYSRDLWLPQLFSLLPVASLDGDWRPL